MYIISIVIENEKSEIGLYNEEYKLLAKKNGLGADAGKLCFDILSESEIKPSDVRYVGIATDGDKGEIIAEIEKAYSIKCCGATLTEARALGEAYAANDAPFSVALKIDDKVGSIKVGKNADLTVLDSEFNVLLTVREGKTIYSK